MRFLVISLVSLHPNRSSCFCEGLELGRLVFDLAMDGFECDKFSVYKIQLYQFPNNHTSKD